MKNQLKRYWNFRILGIPKVFAILLKVSFISVYEKISSFFWKFNLKECGSNILIQKGTSIKFPNQITLGHGVKIGRNCQISSEFDNSILKISDNTFIDKKCLLDYSGSLIIGENVTISEGVMIETHNHGYNPRSNPKKMQLIIEDNVWIGANVTILPNANKIGNNSVIGSGSIITKDVEKNTVVAGNPGKKLKLL